MDKGLWEMIGFLQLAKLQSSDNTDNPPPITTTYTHTGKRGRPRIHIDPDILANSVQFRGTQALTSTYKVSARTIRRRALEEGIVEPGAPVYVTHQNPDGTTYRVYASSTGLQSELTDDELDVVVSQLLTTYPDLGRRLLRGHLFTLGYAIPRVRVQQSYSRVHGPPLAAFGVRRITRRVYRVAGYNSLTHHDGQHGWFTIILMFSSLY